MWDRPNTIYVDYMQRFIQFFCEDFVGLMAEICSCIYTEGKKCNETVIHLLWGGKVWHECHLANCPVIITNNNPIRSLLMDTLKWQKWMPIKLLAKTFGELHWGQGIQGEGPVAAFTLLMNNSLILKSWNFRCGLAYTEVYMNNNLHKTFYDP